MYYELHCHSTFSDGDSTPLQMVSYAKTFLGGIAITDHDEIMGSLEALNYATPDFEVIPGMEVSSKDGHILALYVEKKVDRDLSAKETVERIHALGGLAVAAHPFDKIRKGVGDLIAEVEFDAVEVVNGHTFGNIRDPINVCRDVGIPMVGGSDAHALKEVGSVKVAFEKDFRKALLSGQVKIQSKPKIELLLNHGVGALRRRIKKRM
ncbi:MAG: PHP domain-containing protein [Candidatus Altiarchaeota archaeon]|nr:PHP domain-containing protein [Candidatus Altiarchaeota archaeon]